MMYTCCAAIMCKADTNATPVATDVFATKPTYSPSMLGWKQGDALSDTFSSGGRGLILAPSVWSWGLIVINIASFSPACESF